MMSTGAQGTSPEATNSVLAFVRELHGLLPLDFLQRSFRATPYGIFVAEDAVDKVVDTYGEWLTKVSDGNITKSPAKCFKRLFGSTEPQRRYLIEGKHCLTGYLIEIQIAEPHRLGMPHFLGSLSDMRSYIHPRDPILTSLRGVEMQAASDGFDFVFSSNNEKFRITNTALAEFASYATRAARLLREEPELADSLAAALRLLVKLIGKSRPVHEDLEFVVPERFSDLKRYKLRSLGSLTFVFDKQGCLLNSYDLAATNLVRFIKSEFNLMRGSRLGSFEVLGPRERALGCFNFSGDRLFLGVRAFIEFFNLLRHSPDKREHFSRVFTVRQCFQKFSDIFQLSVQIDRHKIATYAQHARDKGARFRINGNWIFLVGRGGLIEGCLAKHAHLRPSHGHGRRPGRQDRPRRRR